MKNKLACALAATLIVSATSAICAIKEESFSVTPLVGGYVYDNDQHLGSTLLLGARAGYGLTREIGIEALYDHAIRNKGISLNRFGGQALYHFLPDTVFVPYLAAGGSAVNFGGTGTSSKLYGSVDYGVGVKYFVTEDVALRGDIRHIIYRYDSSAFNNVEYTLGAYFQFGAPAPAMKAIAPLPADPPKLGTAKPVMPTPAPAPPADSDGDGVADTLDKCPGTPVGVAVDLSGCPLDSDRDGVYDYLDKCPGTPAGVAVDSKGCPIDSDNDGVADYLDKCPGTPAGVAVDVLGCPAVVAKRFCDKPTSVAVSFDTNRSEIKANYHEELEKLGKFLKEFPGSKGIIEGHTDSDGSAEANMRLSLARAESVRDYLISNFGIDASRISAKGYGPTKPVASNKTAAGKAKNRRIEAVFSCD